MNTRSDNIEWPFKESPIPELLGSKPPTYKTVLLHFKHFHDGTGGSAKKRDASTTTASNVQSWWKKYISEANLMSNTWIVKLILGLHEKTRQLKKYKTKCENFKGGR